MYFSIRIWSGMVNSIQHDSAAELDKFHHITNFSSIIIYTCHIKLSKIMGPIAITLKIIYFYILPKGISKALIKSIFI
jgi:hypothetical protein